MSPIDYELWQNIKSPQVGALLFAQPLLFWPNLQASGIGLYAFFKLKGDHEYLRYVGKASDLFNRLRAPRYHSHWLPSDAVRILPFPIWCTPRIRTWSDLEGYLDLAEIHLIGKYNPPRNTHWRSGPPHELCTAGRPVARQHYAS
jgi:hypothetical protein